jgi:hypothetical protein
MMCHTDMIGHGMPKCLYRAMFGGMGIRRLLTISIGNAIANDSAID